MYTTCILSLQLIYQESRLTTEVTLKFHHLPRPPQDSPSYLYPALPMSDRICH